MELIFAAMMGYCGTRWWKWPWPKPDPEPWWNVIVIGMIGAITGAIVDSVLGPHFASAGMFGTALLGFSAGKIAGDVFGGAINTITSKQVQ